MIRCMNKAHNVHAADVHHHDTLAQVRLCQTRRLVESLEEAAYLEIESAMAQVEYESELAYEHFLETRYSDEFRAEEEYERQMGLV